MMMQGKHIRERTSGKEHQGRNIGEGTSGKEHQGKISGEEHQGRNIGENMKTERKERTYMKQIRHLLSFICVLTCALLLPHSLTLAATGKTDGGNGTAQEPVAAATAVYKGVDYSRVYDYDFYTTHNSVAKRYAGKPEKAIAYFVKYGMDKQHQACAGFDVVSYRFGCPKLRKQFGTDYKKYYLHYQQTGYKKAYYRKRATGITSMQEPVTRYGKIELGAIYDYFYYISKYPFVVSKVGDDDTAVLRNFVEKGLERGRTGKDPGKYKEADPSSKTYAKLKKEITKTNAYDGTGIVVCIDPGHQKQGDYSKEPVGPGSGIYKTKVTSGAYGRWSGKNEYEINLEVSKKLRDELIARGYTVVMTRTKHKVKLSNIDRAKIANAANADIFVRIHANHISESSQVHGVLCYAAAKNNPYLSKKVIKGGQRLATLLRDAQAAATGQRKLDNMYENDMTGINWAKMPTCIVEMGFMSNPTEDARLGRDRYQTKIANGLANGIDRYFKGA